MAYPGTANPTPTDLSSGSGSRNVNLPGSIPAGARLLAFVRTFSTSSDPRPSTPSGWDLLDSFWFGAVTEGVAVSVFERNPTSGSEGASQAFSFPIATTVMALVYLISDSQEMDYERFTSDANVNVDSPSLTVPWGSAENLWITYGAKRGSPTWTTPTDYTGRTEGGAGSSSARRELTAATENPGALSTTGGSSGVVAYTVAFSPLLGPVISDIDPNEFTPGASGIVIAGSNFAASGNTVELGDSSNYDTATKVTQTITAEGASSITFTHVPGSHTPGSLWAWVTDDDDNRSEAFPVTLLPPPPPPPPPPGPPPAQGAIWATLF